MSVGNAAKSQIADRMHTSGYLEAILRFGCWMAARRTPATFRDVMDAFPVNRATAYRWLNAWRRANGLPSLAEENPHHLKRKA